MNAPAPGGVGDATVAALEAAALTLPATQVKKLAAALAGVAGPGEKARVAAWQVVANARFRQHVTTILGAWALECPQLPGAAIALALRTASAATEHLRAQVDVDIAWTGPDSYLVPVRRTREVLLDVINSANHTLVLVSFAAYKVPDVLAALQAAADRGVDVRLILETKEDSKGALSFDAAKAFAALAGKVAFYVWPADLRPDTPSGKAALHAKAALADDAIAFVTSANLTGAAQNDNIELGLVVRGGPIPKRLTAHFRTLMNSETLRPVTS